MQNELLTTQNAFAGTERNEPVFDDPLNRSPEHEPDEPDPESTYAPDVPAVSIPDTSEADVPPEVSRTFWSVVVLADIGVLAVSLGCMFIYFRGQLRLGGAGVVLGVAALAHGYYIYRRQQNH